MSRSKQEALLLEERIEKIRKKNEEIKRRHLEVEADKQNAAKLNALVQVTSPTEDWPIGGRSPPDSHERSRGVRSEHKGPQQKNGSKSGSAECCTFGEQRGGPPRDPAYKFLADKERDCDRRYSQQQPQWRGKSGAWNRGAFTRDRGKRSSPQQGRGRDVPQPEYDAWRAERNRIDSDRISRQRTAEGHWRREWDNEKTTQEEEDVRRTAKVSRGGGFHRSSTVCHPYDDHEAHTIQDRMRPGENSSSRPSQVLERDGRVHGISREIRGNIRGRRSIQAQTHQIQDSRGENAVAAHGERSVISAGESIKISFANNSPAPPVRVNDPVVAGTGRVGPRQNLRISYSSQSEDEVPSRRVELQPCRTSSNNKAPPDSIISNHAATAAAALSKPPLPPTGMKQDPKPKRQRTKRLEHCTKLRKQGGKEEINTTEVSKCTNKKEEEEEEEETVTTVENCQREIESGGDDSWEDVTTTSGNDSACEELSPHSNIDSTVDAKSAELNSGMLLNTEVEPEMVQNTEVKLEMIQNSGVKSELLQNTEVNSKMVQNMEVKSEMVQNTEVKSGMFQSTEEEPVMIQKSQLLQNMEAKCEILQNTEVKTGNLHNTEVKSGMDQDTEANPGMIQNTEVKSGTLQYTETKMGILQADGSSLNSESDNCTEVSKVIADTKVPDTIMQEVTQETLMSERSTDHSELEDVSESYFDKTHSDMLVTTKEGTMNETMELKEEENIQLVICTEKGLEGESVICTEKGLEGESKTGSWNGCGHSEGQGKVDIIQTTGSGSLSDGVAAAVVPEEKQESHT